MRLLDAELGDVKLLDGVFAEHVVEAVDQFRADEIPGARLFQVGQRLVCQGAHGHVAELGVVLRHLGFECLAAGAHHRDADEKIARTHGAGDVDQQLVKRHGNLFGLRRLWPSRRRPPELLMPRLFCSSGTMRNLVMPNASAGISTTARMSGSQALMPPAAGRRGFGRRFRSRRVCDLRP